MRQPTDEELRPYGFQPGKFTGWCAACSNPVQGMGARAFKCKPCAVKQWRQVEKLCDSAGVNDE